MRPLAKALTKSLEAVRCLLREAALYSGTSHEVQTEKLTQSLKVGSTSFSSSCENLLILKKCVFQAKSKFI